MADKKPLAVRIVEALREHKQLTLEQLAKHADTTVHTLYTMMGTLKKQHGVAKVGQDGRAAIFGFAVKSAPPPAQGQGGEETEEACPGQAGEWRRSVRRGATRIARQALGARRGA